MAAFDSGESLSCEIGGGGTPSTKRTRALRELSYLEIKGSTKIERRTETFDEDAALLTPPIDFDLRIDLSRLYELVRSRIAEPKAAAVG